MLHCGRVYYTTVSSTSYTTSLGRRVLRAPTAVCPETPRHLVPSTIYQLGACGMHSDSQIDRYNVRVDMQVDIDVDRQVDM